MAKEFEMRVTVWQYYLQEFAPEDMALIMVKGRPAPRSMKNIFEDSAPRGKLGQATIDSGTLRHVYTFRYVKDIEEKLDDSEEDDVTQYIIPASIVFRVKRLIERKGIEELYREIKQKESKKGEESQDTLGGSHDIEVLPLEIEAREGEEEGEAALSEEEKEHELPIVQDTVVVRKTGAKKLAETETVVFRSVRNLKILEKEEELKPVESAKKVNTVFQRVLEVLGVLAVGTSIVLVQFGFHWVVIPVGVVAAVALFALSRMQRK